MMASNSNGNGRLSSHKAGKLRIIALPEEEAKVRLHTAGIKPGDVVEVLMSSRLPWGVVAVRTRYGLVILEKRIADKVKVEPIEGGR